MDLERLRENLARLTISELEELELVNDEGWDEEIVMMLQTPESLDKKQNSSTCIAAINNQKHKLIIISNGLLYNAASRAETGKEVEVARVLVTEEKAKMLLAAIEHSFPELLDEELSGSEDYSTDGPDEASATPAVKTEPKTKVEIADDENVYPLQSLGGLDSLDKMIATLRNNIYLLEKAKQKGYELVETTNDEFKLKKATTEKKVSSDAILDAYEKCKNKVIELAKIRQEKVKTSGEVAVASIPRNGGKTLFISTSPHSKMIHLMEANLSEVASQDFQLRGNVSLINADSQLSKRFFKMMSIAFAKKPAEIPVTPTS